MIPLCKRCGSTLDQSKRVCGCCGALNPFNVETQMAVQQQHEGVVRATKKFSSGFFVAGIIFGFILFVIHMILLMAAPFSFMKMEAFAGAVTAGMMVVFGFIGVSRNEGVLKGILISGGASIGMLLMNIFLLF